MARCRTCRAAATCSLLSRGAYTPNSINAAPWFRSLAAHDLATVRAALDAHIADPQCGRFVPVPADILAQIEGAAANDGRPGAEAAWAIAQRGVDETVVWAAEQGGRPRPDVHPEEDGRD